MRTKIRAVSKRIVRRKSKINYILNYGYIPPSSLSLLTHLSAHLSATNYTPPLTVMPLHFIAVRHEICIHSRQDILYEY